MKADHGRTLALLVGRCLCALALAHVSLTAHAVNKSNIGRWGITQNGRTTTLTPGAPPVNSGGSTIPISPTSGGWTQAGNYGVPIGATGPTAGLNVNGTFIQGERGNFNIGGAGGVQGIRYPASGSYQVPWSTLAPVVAGVVCVVGTAGACGVAGAVAAASPYIIDWMTRAGLRRNPDTGDIEREDPTGPQPSDGYVYQTGTTGSQQFPSRSTACDAAFAEILRINANNIANGTKITNPRWNTSQCFATLQQPNNGAITDPWVYTTITRITSSCWAGNWWVDGQCVPTAQRRYLPVPPGDLGPALAKVNPDPRVWGETLERGGEIPMPNPTVTGPTSIQGPERTTTNPDGSRTVERTTYNFQTAGNTVNNISNVTTTTTYNTDNSVRSTSTTTTTPTEEAADPEDPCEKRPNSIGCQELDEPPKGEIPKETKTITYAEEGGIAGGSCPADVMWSPQSVAGTYKFIDWQQACGWALQLRWLVVLLATWAAFWIVMPGNTQVKPQ